jgi:hypothetical protein
LRGGGQGAVYRVEAFWRQGVSGVELYRYATDQANAMGWVLHLDIKGHRVSDFPHAIYKGGNLGDFDQAPNAVCGFWKSRLPTPAAPVRRVYEDLLI